MRISKEMLDKFIEIHYQKHGEVLGHEEAYEEASNFLKLIELVESNTYE